MDGYKSSPKMRLDVVNKLYKVWGLNPTLRFGQLVACIVKDKDLFSLYDESFLSMLEAFDNEHSTDPR